MKKEPRKLNKTENKATKNMTKKKITLHEKNIYNGNKTKPQKNKNKQKHVPHKLTINLKNKSKNRT